MFAVCSIMWTLNECFYCRGSYVETLLSFAARFPDENSVVVYRDVRGRGDPGDLQFICTINHRELTKLKEKYKFPQSQPK